MISSGGGGAYDTLLDGAGIDNTLMDIAGIEAVRDSEFSGDIFTLYISNESRLINWIENELNMGETSCQ